MKNDQALVQAAQAEGVLPAQASEVLNDPSPSWVVTALSFVGAQFAVWPFLVFLALLGYKIFFEPPMSFVLAGLLLTVAVLGMRQAKGLFVTHLCFTALLLGMGLLAFSIGFARRGDNGVLLVLLAVQVGAALLVRVDWVQRILGFMAAFTFMLVFIGSISLDDDRAWRMAMPHLANAALLALAWAAWCAYEARLSTHALARNASAFSSGVGVALLYAALVSSGSVFTMGSLWGSGTRMGSADSATAGTAQLFQLSWLVGLQWLLTLGACAWLVRRWGLHGADKRRELLALSLVYLCLMVLAFFTHDAGVVALVGTVALATGRKRLLALALFVLLAQLSGFYYALAWPLVKKAGVLAVVGASLGVALWLLQRMVGQTHAAATGTPNPTTGRGRFALPLIAVGALLSLGAANYDVLKKEQVIAGGQKIFIALAPRDPRSLMQGDYMALNFGFPLDIQSRLGQGNDDGIQRRASVVAKLDERSVATVLRVAAPNEPLAAGEMLLPLQRKNNNWVLVTDAFYFPEGMGTPFSQARFGEFRALPDGRALLVGLVNEQLVPIVAQRRVQSN
jgi:uncharacterized membrane-anchored protein